MIVTTDHEEAEANTTKQLDYKNVPIPVSFLSSSLFDIDHLACFVFLSLTSGNDDMDSDDKAACCLGCLGRALATTPLAPGLRESVG
jgi:hypothetical protein